MEDDSARRAEPAKKPLPAQWVALLDRLAATHPVSDRSDGWLCLAWPGEPEQTVQINLTEVAGRMRLIVTADICRGDQVSHTDALELAAKLLVGGVILRNGILSLRQVFSEDAAQAGKAIDLSPQSRSARLLEETIAALREDGVRMRRLLLERQAQRAAGHFRVD